MHLLLLLALLLINTINAATFFGFEHRDIGDEAWKLLQQQQQQQQQPTHDYFQAMFDDSKLKLTNGLQLSYGDIIALGGDYFADPKRQAMDTHPEAVERAWDDFGRRPQTKHRRQYMNDALHLIQLQREFHENNTKLGGKLKHTLLKPSKRYPNVLHRSERNPLWAVRVGLKFLRDKPATGLDHFAQSAISTYSSFMNLALATAQQAHTQQSVAKAADAMGISAYAAHFLTDRFASGHIRCLARELSGTCKTKLGAFVLRNLCHLEDSRNGLWVKNAAGTEWRSVGDQFLYPLTREAAAVGHGGDDAANTRREMLRALLASMNDVIQVLRNGRASASSSSSSSSSLSALQYIPHPIVDDKRNKPPVIKKDEKTGRILFRVSQIDEQPPKYRPMGEGADGCMKVLFKAASLMKVCFKQGKQTFLLAPGRCLYNRRRSRRRRRRRQSRRKMIDRVMSVLHTKILRPTCKRDAHCVSSKTSKCQGQCVCGRHRINECVCVKPQTDSETFCTDYTPL